ncbi:uroporphyrinogen decarboxylase [Isoptericola sp. NEAU-Y5]|uniref:Uroporphyrinogen decarboxylase n=1 Tax=Isoptericola luteus TaxID=2879484 RepID=A0ABS7ZHK1_9MICO|nr:uroporphyrinogen decarboxylase [Isoptericola sp. NEAU-Y5]MCA5894509.1 uroporphyrinogen decarboxylase [Isoptericola sp. NEAU-Y5]
MTSPTLAATAPVHLPADHPLVDGRTSTSPLVRALRGDRPATTPVWFMRQAGRSLPEYREVRQGVGMIESCLMPHLAAEITLQPVRRHRVDAAIFFSDIVVPLRLAGVDVDIKAGVGPVMDRPYRTADDVARLVERGLTEEALAPITDAVRRTVAGLDELSGARAPSGAREPDNSPEGSTTPLIGFGGAPFTLAAYLVEGRPSRDHLAARTLMHADPETWARLTAWTADLTGAFLRAQVLAGASAVQLFDSWAGSLSLADYQAHVAPSSMRALTHVADLRVPGSDTGVPGIHFGTGTAHLLPAMRNVLTNAGITHPTVGVDYRTPLDEAAAAVGRMPLQGNVDPALLGAPWPVLEAHVRDVVARGAGAPGHVVNLGHGVPPDTDPTVLTRVVELVHSL